MGYKQYLNQSNKDDLRHIFETSTGMLNIAPIKISGQYKIVVGQDFTLYLDDYTGRRKLINKNDDFLSQVSDFLSTKTIIKNNSLLRFGGTQNGTTKKFHIPLYIGFSEKLPKYFVLSKVSNNTISNSSTLYNGKLLKVIDFEKIGLTKIFETINKEDNLNYPLYFNLDDDYIKIFGYSITKGIQDNIKIDNLKYFRANQTYIENLNNKILNFFNDNNMIFPKFINIEFEFEYQDEFNFFNNFYGYVSYGEKINQIQNDYYYCKLQEYKSNIEISQITNTTNITDIVLSNYIDIVSSGSVQEISEQLPMVRFSVANINVNDLLKIYNNLGELDFEYKILLTDINKTSLYGTLVKIAENCNKLSKKNYLFSVEKNNNINYFVIKSNIATDFEEDYYVEMPIYFKILDRFGVTENNYNKFRGITINDIWLCGQPNLFDTITTIAINKNQYNIVEKFKFFDKTIIRLDNAPNITGITEAVIYENKTEEILKLEPLSFLTYNTDFKSLLCYDGDLYCDDLQDKFGVVENIDVENFRRKIIPTQNQYIKDNDDLIDVLTTDIVEVADYNTEIVKNMNFSSIGQNSTLTPNILNFDKRFYQDNCCLNIDKFNTDIFRYNWFLIKGECPEYLLNDYRKLRYFENNKTPKLLSRIYKITDNLCETIFLGVKYQLPLKYNNYSFAVYIDSNDRTKTTMKYEFIVNDTDKTVLLALNYYLDFQDLIRQGDINKQAFLDLSFFYSVSESFNKSSDNFSNFKKSKLSICTKQEDLTGLVLPQSITDSFVDDRVFPAVDNEIIIRNIQNINPIYINDLTVLFSEGAESIPFYLYATVNYEGEVVTYKSAEIKFLNISKVTQEYLVCGDIQINFYPDDEIFVSYSEFDVVLDNYVEKIVKIKKSEISNQQYESTNIFGNFTQNVTVDGKTYKLLLPLDTFNFKSNYFELTRTKDADTDIVTKSLFTFTNSDIQLTEAEMFDLLWPDNDDISVYGTSKITIFERNQIYNTIRELFLIDLKFKQYSEAQVRKIIDEYMITNLYDYTSINSIKIANSELDEYIKLSIIKFDSNLVVWNLYNKAKIYQANRYKAPYLPYLPIVNSEYDFQLDSFKKHNSIFNLYDVNFGGENISATGLWQEINGNIVSSLFCKEKDIVLSTNFNTSINYFDLLKEYFTDINKLIITNKNETYIGNINKNIDAYITESFINYLLSNFYILSTIENSTNKKIEFTYNSKNSKIINLNELSFGENSNIIYLTFKRK